MQLTVNIEDLRQDFGGHVVHGVLTAFGTHHHVRLHRVKEGDAVEPLDDAPAEAKELFDDAQDFWDGAYHTVAVPGLPGRYAMFVFPFAE